MIVASSRSDTRSSLSSCRERNMAMSRRSLLLHEQLLVFLRHRGKLRSMSCPVSNPPTCRSYRPLTSIENRNAFRFLSASSITAVEADASILGSESHPWPEWVNFMAHLKDRGYLKPKPVEAATHDNSDFAHVKAACLTFAREHQGALGSLHEEDIRTLVESGCPNLLRKAVNSAKRLRAYMKLDEGEVCDACSLRESCDRAYIIAKEDEEAHMIDVMRVLLYYAMGPFAVSNAAKNRKHVEITARRILSELIERSEAPSRPSPVKIAMLSGCNEELHIPVRYEKKIRNTEMKKGDWICSKCNFMNFAKNIHCLQCKGDGRRDRVGIETVERKKGDWTCTECRSMNFARKTNCFRCHQPRTSEGLLPGEWLCSSCQFMNFSRNHECLQCQQQKPKTAKHPGEWDCSS